MVCNTKDGYLINVFLALRLHNSLNNGLEFIGVLNFETKQKSFKNDHFLLLTDVKGNIKSFTKPASKYFRKDDKIFQYSSELREVYDVKEFLKKFLGLRCDLEREDEQEQDQW